MSQREKSPEIGVSTSILTYQELEKGDLLTIESGELECKVQQSRLIAALDYSFILTSLSSSYMSTESKSGLSYLRSSGWNLVGLAGDSVQSGVLCSFSSLTIACDKSRKYEKLLDKKKGN